MTTGNNRFTVSGRARVLASEDMLLELSPIQYFINCG